MATSKATKAAENKATEGATKVVPANAKPEANPGRKDMGNGILRTDR